jgi:hypothetical protein
LVQIYDIYVYMYIIIKNLGLNGFSYLATDYLEEYFILVYIGPINWRKIAGKKCAS